jgi:putative nucleotide binding protein
MEDNAVILDYLPLGYVNEDLSTFKRQPIAQSIGIENFTLLELTPKEGVDLEIHENVYIGAGKRDKINRVKGKLDFENLTATSRIEIDYVIREIIEAHEDKYVKFFNEAESLNTRLHKLELIPGIGKKHMWDIIKVREEKPFESFEDIQKRVTLLSDPISLLVKRIKMELDNSLDKRGKNKYNLFTRFPRKSNSKRRDNPRKRDSKGYKDFKNRRR